MVEQTGIYIQGSSTYSCVNPSWEGWDDLIYTDIPGYTTASASSCTFGQLLDSTQIHQTLIYGLPGHTIDTINYAMGVGETYVYDLPSPFFNLAYIKIGVQVGTSGYYYYFTNVNNTTDMLGYSYQDCIYPNEFNTLSPSLRISFTLDNKLYITNYTSDLILLHVEYHSMHYMTLPICNDVLEIGVWVDPEISPTTVTASRSIDLYGSNISYWAQPMFPDFGSTYNVHGRVYIDDVLIDYISPIGNTFDYTSYNIPDGPKEFTATFTLEALNATHSVYKGYSLYLYDIRLDDIPII